MIVGGNPQLLGIIDNVIVGQNVTVGSNHKTGADHSGGFG